MNKRKGINLALSCFMVTSIIGLGFTGFKPQEVNAKSINLYSSTINAKEISNQIVETNNKEKNFIDTLESKVDIEIIGYTLKLGNKKIATLQTPSEISDILDNIKAPFAENDDEDIQVVSTQILEELSVSKEEVHLKDINKKEEVIDYIKTGGEEIKVHTVEVGESFSTIGQIYDISTEELEKNNSDKDGENLQPGEEVTINTTKPLMTVITKEEIESTVKTDYQIEVKEDPEMYNTKSEMEVEGEAGENRVTTEQIRQNGKVIGKEIIKEEVIKEPINQIVLKGTKEPPTTEPTGSFLMPSRGRISSPFGQRWGRMHRGIDIAIEEGSDIQAADGGTISESGVKGTYGNMIEIDHGNGYKTRYAHCSKLLFDVGTKVYKGQVIAEVGNTGRSTGPHLHFEVIKDGENQDPSSFVQ